MTDDTPEPSGPGEPPEAAASSHRTVIVRLAIAVEGGLLVLAGLVGWLVDQPPLLHFAWSLQAAALGLAAALPLLALFVLVLRWPIGPFRSIVHFSERVFCPLLASCSVLDLLGISALAGLGEELFFRGVVQASVCNGLIRGARLLPHEALSTSTSTWLGQAAGIVLASLFFGLLHAVTWTYAVLAALMGAYLGCIWLATENLLTVVVTHAVYDFVVLLWLLRGPGSTERRAAPLELPAEEEPEA